MQTKIPLVVDVDGALVDGDLLRIGAARLLAGAPFAVFALALWLLRGRARLKRRVAESAPLPVESLSLNEMVMNEIAAARADGREVWLASGSDEIVVAPLAARIGADGYLASNGRVNLIGRKKADALTARFGAFDYIGDARCDLAVWKCARNAIGVNLSRGVKRELRKLHSDARFLDCRNG